jgi:hypothetical protein
MIVIFNLNEYLGGGETLALRFAEHLRARNDEYCLLVAAGDCWLAEQAATKGLNVVLWPVAQRGLPYMRDSDRNEVAGFVGKVFGGSGSLRVFSFCFRDLYNAIYFFGSINGPDVKVAHGVYHAEDVLYLSSFALDKGAYIEANRRLAKKLIDHGSMLFMNSIGCCFTLGNADPEWVERRFGRFFHAIPINLREPIPIRQAPRDGEARVICVSRFVEFKIGAVLAIMRAVAPMKSVSLTVVGHGSYKWVIDLWMLLRRPANIRVLTGIGPDELDRVIDAHHVGYAQGTAILEIGKRGLPVIIAPYSRLRDVVNVRFGTLGIFGEVRGERAFGEMRDVPDNQKLGIRETLQRVNGDYASYSELTRRYVSEFDAERVFPNIREFIQNAKYDPRSAAHEVPRPPFLKRIVSRLFGEG